MKHQMSCLPNALTLGLCIVALGSIHVFAAKDGVPVTISGCVQAGTRADTYVLSNVEETIAGKTQPVRAIYWLSTTKGLIDHIGHQVAVAGTYSPTRDAGKTGKVKIESDSKTGEVVGLKVENGMKSAEAKNEVRAVGTSGVITEVEKPYRRLEVQSLTMLAPACR
jgi:hypothetical protein